VSTSSEISIEGIEGILGRDMLGLLGKSLPILKSLTLRCGDATGVIGPIGIVIGLGAGFTGIEGKFGVGNIGCRLPANLSKKLIIILRFILML
jgi:hypothetical protein